MLGSCRLNNKSMRNVRRNEAYQAMAIDLAMLGVISKEECEMLLGSGIPSGIVLPNGKAGQIISEKNLPKQPDFIQTESDGGTEPEVPVTMGQETESTNQEPTVTDGTDTQDTVDGAQDTEQKPEIVTPNADIVGAGFVTQDAADTVTTDSGDVSPIESDTETQEPVNANEGTTESDN